ncbi:hypothetical protein AYI68_g5208 [Smittium mucronatum]|uniref:Uncharacterized protein n=1 Tax=Smittium mucronatum TaxID=133383 RepID=A0A1R0GUX1_9FUNG|nr:hypothetical protein AYI68_g5208 [Smittium mucronatum]
MFLPVEKKLYECISSAILVLSSLEFSEMVSDSENDLSQVIGDLYSEMSLEKLFIIIYGYPSFTKNSNSSAVRSFASSFKKAIKNNSFDIGKIPPAHPHIVNNPRKPDDDKNIGNRGDLHSEPNVLSLSSENSDSSINSESGGNNTNKKKRKKNLNNVGALGKEVKEASLSETQDAIIGIEYDFPNTFFFLDIDDISSLGRIIAQITTNVALIPFSDHHQNISKNDIFRMGLNIDSSNIKSGVGFKDTYIKFLEQIPKVTPMMAKGISNKYQTIEKLYRSWDAIKAKYPSGRYSANGTKTSSNTFPAIINDKDSDPKYALSEILVNNGRGYGDRPIGPSVSQIVYNFFNSNDPYQNVLDHK